MPSIEERLAMLDEIIENKTPEQLYQELSKHEPVGPKAADYLEKKSDDEYDIASVNSNPSADHKS